MSTAGSWIGESRWPMTSRSARDILNALTPAAILPDMSQDAPSAWRWLWENKSSLMLPWGADARAAWMELWFRSPALWTLMVALPAGAAVVVVQLIAVASCERLANARYCLRYGDGLAKPLPFHMLRERLLCNVKRPLEDFIVSSNFRDRAQRWTILASIGWIDI